MKLSVRAVVAVLFVLVCSAASVHAATAGNLLHQELFHPNLLKMPPMSPLEMQLAHPEDSSHDAALPLPIHLTDGERKFFVVLINRLAGAGPVATDPMATLARSSCRERSTAC